MDELPPDDPHQTIQLGGETAVLVPLDEYLRFRESEVEAEQLAATLRFEEQHAAGESERGMTTEEVRQYLDLAQPLTPG